MLDMLSFEFNLILRVSSPLRRTKKSLHGPNLMHMVLLSSYHHHTRHGLIISTWSYHHHTRQETQCACFTCLTSGGCLKRGGLILYFGMVIGLNREGA